MAQKKARPARVRKPKRQTKPATAKDYVVAAVLAVIVVWLVFLNVSIYHKEEIARTAAKSTQAQLASLKARETTLQDNINELSTERGQEATLRDTFGVAKPGEDVIVVIPANVATSTPPLTFWQKWFGWLKL
jgi:cell division protein FtsB